MLKARILTALIGIPLFLAVLIAGPIPWAILLSILGVIMTHELIGMFSAREMPVVKPAAYLAAPLFCLLELDVFTSTAVTGLVDAGAAFAMAAIFALAIAGALVEREQRLPAIITALFAAFYIGFMISRLVGLREEAGGLILVLIVLAVVWLSDTAAYFVGRAYGRHKLAPSISPNKTVEGAVGGFLAGAASGPLIALAVPDIVSITPAIILGVVVAVAAQAGDLFESAIKRSAGVKDSGTILPGHGGLLDRFDSLLFAGAAAYLVTRFL